MQDAKGIKEESLPIPPEDQELKMGPQHAASASSSEAEAITRNLAHFQSALKALATSELEAASFFKSQAIEVYLQTKKKQTCSADTAFDKLFSNLKNLSAEHLEQFAALANSYFEIVLLNRSQINALFLQGSLPLPVILNKRWLERYSKIGETVHTRLTPTIWLQFCQQAGKILLAKGYYQFEPPLTNSESFDLMKHAEWQEYHKELYRRLIQQLFASLILNSGRVAKSTDFKDGTATLTGNFIPGIGGVASAAFREMREVTKHREVSKISRWIVTSGEIDDFADRLALSMTILRKDKLLQLKSSDFSLVTRTEWFIKALKEATSYGLPNKLALLDMDIISKLFSTCQPSNSLEKELRVATNVAKLQKAFQQELNKTEENDNLSLLDQLKQKITKTFNVETQSFPSASDAKMTPLTLRFHQPLINTTAHAWLFYQAGLHAAIDCGDHKVQQNLEMEITHLQKLGSIQQCADYWVLSCLNQLSEFKTQSPTWQAVIDLFKIIQKYMELPYQEYLLELLWPLFSPVWSAAPETKDFHQQALQNHLSSITNATSCKTLHSQVMLILVFLKRFEQEATANEQARRYLEITNNLVQQTQKQKNDLDEKLKPLENQKKIKKNNYEEWKKNITKRQQELAYKLNISIENLIRDAQTTEEKIITPVITEFTNKLHTVWQQGRSTSEFNREYGEHAWKKDYQKNFTSFKQMCVALYHVLIKLEKLIDADQTAFVEKENETIQPLKEQYSATLELYHEWGKAHSEAADYHHMTLNPISSSASSSSMTREKKSEVLADNLVQRLETELGPPPCGFAILSIKLLFNKTSDEKIRAVFSPSPELHFGILVVDQSKRDDPYWQAYARLWHWHQQCQDPVNSTTKEIIAWVSAPNQLTNHILFATNEGHSQYDEKKATILFSQFEAERDQQLKQQKEYDSESKKKLISYQRIYGYHGLYFLFNSPLPSDFTPITHSINNNLLIPLSQFILHLGMYCEISLPTLTSATATLDALVAQGSLSTAFATDLRGAINWSIQQLRAASKTKALSAEQLQEFKQHHHFTVEALWQSYKIEPDKETLWRITQEISQLDPLWEWFRQKHHALKHNYIPIQEIDQSLDFLIQIILHRQQFSLEKHKQYLLDLPKPERFDLRPSIRLIYLHKLEKALPPEHHQLIQHLRHAPNPSGQRLAQEEERLQWEQDIQIIWQPSAAEQISSPEREIKETICVSAPLVSENKTTDTENAPKIVRVRFNSEKNWQLETHTLPSVIADQLFKAGKWLDKPKDATYGGNHRVYPIILPGEKKPRFWIKVYPEQPSIEYLITELDRRLGVGGTPYFELVKFKHGEETSAAIIVSAVNGICLQSVYQEPEKLAHISFSSFIKTLLRVLLTNPEDDKQDDYFLIEQADGTYLLVRIDNERAFFQPVMPTTKAWLLKSNTLLVKSILFCLEQMKLPWSDHPTIADIVSDFLSLQPGKLFKNLLSEANQLHDGWNQLFSETEITAHFECKDPWNSLPIMCIPKGLPHELVSRFTTMQAALRLNYQNITGLQLLKATQPRLGKYYQDGFEDQTIDHKQVQPRYKRIVDHLYLKDSKNPHSGYKSSIHHSNAMQHSLRLDTPLNLPTIIKIRNKELCSANQALAEIARWSKEQREFTLKDLLSGKLTAVEGWRNLPLNHQALIYKKLQEVAETLSIQQKRFILAAMEPVVARTKWPVLDFKGFESVTTDELLKPILKGAGKRLQQFNIADCRLSEETLEVILSFNPNLRYLSAQGVHWTYFSLNKLSYLEKLDLSGSAIETFNGESPNLRSLKLTNCQQLRSIGKINYLIQDEFFSAPNLLELNMTGCQKLAILRFNLVITNLNLAQCNIKDQVVTIIVPFLLTNLTLKILNLSKNKIGNEETQALVNALQKNSSLSHVNLSGNEIDDKGIENLPHTIRVNTTLESLDLSGNKIKYKKKEMQNLIDAIKENFYITYLSFEDCHLEEKSSTLINPFLMRNRKIKDPLLKISDLSNMRLGSKGAYKIAEILKINTHCTELDISHNDIGDEGITALAEAIKTNSTLTSINLAGNCCTEDGINDLMLAFDDNFCITSISYPKFESTVFKYHHDESEYKQYRAIQCEISNSVYLNRQLKREAESIVRRTSQYPQLFSSVSSPDAQKNKDAKMILSSSSSAALAPHAQLFASYSKHPKTQGLIRLLHSALDQAYPPEIFECNLDRRKYLYRIEAFRSSEDEDEVDFYSQENIFKRGDMIKLLKELNKLNNLIAQQKLIQPR